MKIAIIVLLVILIFITIIATPFQYMYIRSLKEMEKQNKEKGKNQEEIYNAKNVGEQYAHFNIQSNILLLPANLIAHKIYKIKHQ